MPAADIVSVLLAAGVARRDALGVAIAGGVGVGLATDAESWSVTTDDPVAVVGTIEAAIRPRWVWWTKETAESLVRGGVRVAACWDLAAVHRHVAGSWRAEPARVWAMLRGLPAATIPVLGQLDLLSALDATGGDGGDADEPVRPDGHLRPEWVAGGWAATAERAARWAALAMEARASQRGLLAAPHGSARSRARDPESAARSESAAELLCAELQADGLPIDVARAEAIIASFVGPRPTSPADAAELRRQRDLVVQRHEGVGTNTDLRNPSHVKAMLNRIGVDVPDTRAWRLEPFREQNPAVDALLTWRKAERIDTTFGYAWLDEHVGAGGRLRGGWSASDGAAGRMTAQAGLHNMPADLRDAVAAEAGHVFVRADLGQIEPRVLAAVSGDAALAAATTADDLYAPVAAQLGVERGVAKIAVLAAMYGQTSGNAGAALRGLEQAYRVAMRYLQDADDDGRAARDVYTYGGRRVRMWRDPNVNDNPGAMGARGRYARNAVVQGAAAELFKTWAVTVRARGAAIGARIVLCLHDELLVHVPAEHGAAGAALLDDCLQEAAARWAPDRSVRFVSDTSVIRRWSDAKP